MEEIVIIKTQNMTAQYYLEQNLAGFENDSFAKERFKKLIEDNGIDVFIETGTYLGSTTKILSEWCEQVITIESNDINFQKAKNALKETKNVMMFYGSSEKILSDLLGIEDIYNIREKNIGVFLDAHWESFNPLLDELQVIANSKLKPSFIAIHDFKVPLKPDFGYDTYNGQDYEWNWIKEKVENIYGENGYEIEYNNEATGAKRGIIYIQPK